MAIYLILLTVITFIAIYILLDNSTPEAIPFVLLLYSVVGLTPSALVTTETKIKTVPKSTYTVKEITPHKSVLIYNLDKKDTETIVITDSYTLSQIKSGNFHLKSHKHFNMWGVTSAGGEEYYLIPSTEELKK
jgi:hypothetical protein